MRTILVILSMCLLVPSVGYSNDLWSEGEDSYYVTTKNFDDVKSFLVTVKYCLDKDNEYCDSAVEFEVICGSDKNDEPISNRMILTGDSKREGTDKVVIHTADGSEFVLSNMTRTESDIAGYGDLVVDFEPHFKDGLKWENNLCKNEVDYVNKNVNGLVLKLESFLGD